MKFTYTVIILALLVGCSKPQNLHQDQVIAKAQASQTLVGRLLSLPASATSSPIMIGQARVFVDLNFNQQFDGNEPYSWSDELGQFELSLPADQIHCAQFAPVMAFHGQTTLVHAPAFGPFSDTQVLLSPLSSEVWRLLIASDLLPKPLNCQSLAGDPARIVQLKKLIERQQQSWVRHYNRSVEQLDNLTDLPNYLNKTLLAKALLNGLQDELTIRAALTEDSSYEQTTDEQSVVSVRYVQGSYLDNDNVQGEAWYRETKIISSKLFQHKVEKLTADLSEVEQLILHENRRSQIMQGALLTSASVYETRRGKYQNFRCEAKDTVAVMQGDMRYELVNISNAAAIASPKACAQLTERAQPDMRYYIIEKQNEGTSWFSQFAVLPNGQSEFALLNQLRSIGQFDEQQHAELVHELAKLNAKYPIAEQTPNALPAEMIFWYRSHSRLNAEGIKITISYGHASDWQRRTEYGDGTYQLHCASSQSGPWRACQ